MRATGKTFKRARDLRASMTLPEVILWQRLRRSQLDGLRFRRQHPIGPYILDFFHPETQIAIEIDGAAHDVPKQAKHDEQRTRWLETRDIRVLRFAACDLLSEEGLIGVLDTIAASCGRNPPPFTGEVASAGEPEGAKPSGRPLHHASHGPPPPSQATGEDRSGAVCE